jgi:hypothetical protein
MNRRPPDVWAVFLLHQAEGGCAANFCYQAILRFDRWSMSAIGIFRQLTGTSPATRAISLQAAF